MIYDGGVIEEREAIGTTNALYDVLIAENDKGNIDLIGQNVYFVAGAGQKFIEKYSDIGEDFVEIEGAEYSREEVITNLDNNNPVILGMRITNSETTSKTYHVVVAYGYALYEGELGYITHFGLNDRALCVWVPENYFAYQITMNVGHEHSFINDYELLTDIYGNSCYYKVECSICGCILSDCIYKMSDNGDELEGLKYNCHSDLVVPAIIRGITLLSIGPYAFINMTSLNSIDLPETILRIKKNAFEKCVNLKSINFNNNINIETISEGLFKDCTSLEIARIPQNVKTIEQFAFQGCLSLENVIFPEALRKIEYSAFKYCKNLKKINFKNNINIIGDSSFEECASITSVVIPSSVERIGLSAFKNCSLLSKVTVYENDHGIVILGNGAFDECDNLITINVPLDKALKYKNASNWNNYKDKIVFIDNYEENSMDCKNSISINNLEVIKGVDTVIKVNVGCSKSYKFTLFLEDEVNVLVYNKYLSKVETTSTYNNNLLEITVYLSKGINYLDIFIPEESLSEVISDIVIETTPTWPVTSFPANLGTNNVMLHLHKNQLGKYENFLKFDDFDKGFYTFSLILEDYNGLVETPQGSLVLYKDENKSNVWEQYSILNYGTVATNYDACLFVYLDYDDSTYLDIVLDFNDYVSVELIIEKVDEDIFDLYNIDNLTDYDIINYSNNEYTDYIKKIKLNQAGKYNVVHSGLKGGNFVVIREIDIGNNDVDHIIVYNQPLDEFNQEFIIDEGTYYIGYIGSQVDYENTFNVIRLINSFSGIQIYQNGGTEVTLNNGDNSENIITQGFTRLLFLSSGESRLDYWWYTDNEDVSRITEAGTLMALYVDDDVLIKIMAINKNNPSIVIQKIFMISKEDNPENTSIIELEEPIIFNLENEIQKQINLGSIEVPINWLQYYSWESTNPNIKIDQYGRISVTNNVTKGEYKIIGKYKLNPRFTILINIMVV